MKGMAGICFILIGMISIALGTFCLIINTDNPVINQDYSYSGKSENYPATLRADREKLDYTLFKEKLVEQSNTPVQAVEAEQRVSLAKINKSVAASDDSKRKGYTFEKFIIAKFAKKYFKLMEWTSDKYTNGIYAQNAKQPDLVYEFALGDSSYHFAVECKWRRTFYNNEVELATTQQIKNYKAFEKKRGVPVFITLGMGGEPAAPKQLYIIPLSLIFSNKVDQSYLKEFEQVPSRNFFYDFKLQSLSARSVEPVEEQI